MIGPPLRSLIACLLALFTLDGPSRGNPPSWLHNAAGYQQAVYRAQQNGKPLLILLDSADCARCHQLEQQLWQDSALHSGLNDWQLVRLQRVADAATAQLVSHYQAAAELPLVILERAPQGATQPLYFNRTLSQFSLGADPDLAAQPLETPRLLKALAQWLQAHQSPTQEP